MTSLVKTLDKQLDEMATRPGHDRPGVWVIFCNDDAGMQQKLKDLIAKEGVKQVVLSTHGAAGPKRYAVAPEADVTVVIYNNKKVTANFPLKKGGLGKDKAREITKALTQVLPRKQ